MKHKKVFPIPKDRCCIRCNKGTYKTSRGYYQWYNYQKGHLCLNCFNIVVNGSKYYWRHREHAREVQHIYYLTVTKPKLERRKRLIELEQT